MWSPGDVVEYRHVHHGRPWWVAPARVVEDSRDRVVVWWPAGTRYLRPVIDDRTDALRRLAENRWELEPTEWWGGPSLLVVPRDEPYALWPFRLDADGELLGWYCNLQRPLVRTERGFDTSDWTLDIWASADLSSWHWKDEDELDIGERVGLYTARDVVEIRAAGAAVVALIERRDAIFDEWRDWTAPDDWIASPPTLRPEAVGVPEERVSIVVVDYDAEWPRRFEAERAKIVGALGARALAVDHIGSTSVPGLAAKPVIDIILTVADSSDELSYLRDLDVAGYRLRVREPEWHEHRMLRTAARDVHLHVFSDGSPEIARCLVFRDRLRSDAGERARYTATKRALARRRWPTMQHYADAKSEIVEAIIARAST